MGWRLDGEGAKVGKKGETYNTVNNKKTLKELKNAMLFYQTDTSRRSIVVLLLRPLQDEIGIHSVVQ